MSRHYEFVANIDLYVADRVSCEDAAQQEATAREILRRFIDRPGVVLADEVGMGKTFVALAVATSIVLRNAEAGPVVVMVPPSLKEKWPRDWSVYRDKCLPPTARERLRATPTVVESGVAFLQLLDDPPATRH